MRFFTLAARKRRCMEFGFVYVAVWSCATF